jgi:hypothetical protein
MRFLKPVCLLILIFCMSFSCNREKPEIHDSRLTFEDFQMYLTKNMDYQAIVAKFGPPARDIGSGIHIYVWDLKDNTEMWIGFVSQIMYARHMDKNRNILHTII